MDKYILWDEKEKEFINANKPWWEVSHYPDGSFYNNVEKIRYSPKERYHYLKDTELKDISGQPIYADSSIVEFEWLIYKNHQPPIVYNLIGFFYFDERLLKYKIKILNDCKDYDLSYGIEYDFYMKAKNRPKLKNFKIIDTIQENSLGLIKDEL